LAVTAIDIIKISSFPYLQFIWTVESMWLVIKICRVARTALGTPTRPTTTKASKSKVPSARPSPYGIIEFREELRLVDAPETEGIAFNSACPDHEAFQGVEVGVIQLTRP
jgi:hypothetical protein